MTVKQLAKQVAHGNRALKIGSYSSSLILKRKECHTALFSLIFPTVLLEFAKSVQWASRNMTTDDVNILVEYISIVLVDFV